MAENTERIPYSRRPFTRRDLLRGAAVGVAGAAVAIPITRLVSEEGMQAINPSHKERSEISRQTFEESLEKIPEVWRQYYNSIMEYRQAIGLSSPPPEIIENIVDPSDNWEYEEREFKNTLPKNIESYGLRVKEIIDATFAGYSDNLVTEVSVDESGPSNTAFYSGKPRKVVISRERKDTLTENDELILHEAVGHGSDPTLSPRLYPTDILLRVERGKWRMLSQSFSVDGQFFQHPGDLMFPSLKRDIGEQIAKSFRDNQLESTVANSDSYSVVSDILTEISNEEGKPLGELKFNKRISRLVGDKVLTALKNGEIKFGGDLNTLYENKLDEKLVEIYAEMMRMALAHPEDIQYNEEILTGCQEIFSAIQDAPVNLDIIREVLQNPSQEIRERYEFEEKIQPDTKRNSNIILNANPNNLPVQEETRIAFEQNKTIQTQQDTFQSFYSGGLVPNTIDSDTALYSIVKNYAFICSQVSKKYSGIETSSPWLDESFDPQLDIWDIHEIERAANPVYVKALIRTLEDNPQRVNVEEIKQKTDTLANFYTSPAFGT